MSDTLVHTTIAPWLTVGDGAKAMAFYKEALGAAEVYRLDGDDGGVAVAQLKIGDAAFWIQEDVESSLASIGRGSVRMILTVGDPDALFNRAIAAGSTQVARVHDEHGWRTGRVTDPFGHDWEFSRPLATSE